MSDENLMWEAVKAKANEEIAKHLPKQVGDVLAARLLRVDRLEKELEDGKEMLERRDETIERLREHNQELLDKVEKNGELLEREEKIARRERELEHAEMNLELEKIKHERDTYKVMSEKHGEFLQNLAKNVVYREHVFGNRNYDDRNGYRQTDDYSHNVTKSVDEMA